MGRALVIWLSVAVLSQTTASIAAPLVVGESSACMIAVLWKEDSNQTMKGGGQTGVNTGQRLHYEA
eukprot:2703593-Amphidinium_carterae.1